MYWDSGSSSVHPGPLAHFRVPWTQCLALLQILRRETQPGCNQTGRAPAPRLRETSSRPWGHLAAASVVPSPPAPGPALPALAPPSEPPGPGVWRRRAGRCCHLSATFSRSCAQPSPSPTWPPPPNPPQASGPGKAVITGPGRGMTFPAGAASFQTTLAAHQDRVFEWARPAATCPTGRCPWGGCPRPFPAWRSETPPPFPGPQFGRKTTWFTPQTWVLVGKRKRVGAQVFKLRFPIQIHWIRISRKENRKLFLQSSPVIQMVRQAGDPPS